MNRRLARQLKKVLGFSNPVALEAYLQAQGIAPSDAAPSDTTPFDERPTSEGPTETPHDQDQPCPLTRGQLQHLLTRIDQSYEQYDRDLTLRERSLELSSTELTEAYEKLWDEMQQQSSIVSELRSAANTLLKDFNRPAIDDDITSLQRLSQLMLELANERQKAQKELALQKLALDEHAIVSITDAQFRLIYANDKYCQISGYDRDELIGHPHPSLSLEAQKDAANMAFFDEIKAHIQQGLPWNGHIKIHNRTGQRLWFAATIFPIRNDSGATERFIEICTDITPQKELEEQLHQSHQFYRSITNAAGEGIYAVDADGIVQFMNPEASQLLGWPLSSLKQHCFYDMVSVKATRSDHDTPKPSLWHQIHHGEIYRSDEDIFRRHDGSEFPISIIAVPLKNERQQVTGHVAVFQDISERKTIEARLLATMQKAETANRAKSEFLANMSHEIRTPMNAIIGLTHLALGTNLTHQQREYIEKAHHSAHGMLNIINDILDLSKIEAGQIELSLRAFDLEILLNKLSNLLTTNAQAKKLLLIFDIDPTLTGQWIGDDVRLHQILLNLLANALKFTETGSVKLSLRGERLSRHEMLLIWSVQDTGIGIDADVIPRLFMPFTQADSSTSRQYGGTGLGLAISKRLAEQMNGQLTVKSQPKLNNEQTHGSTFTLSLPLQRQHESFHDPLPLATRPIAILADRTEIQTVLAHTLSGLGLTLIQPDPTLLTSQTLKSIQPMIVMAQFEHESSPWFKLLQRLEEAPQVRLIFIVAESTEMARPKLFRLGFNDAELIPLPFTPNSLVRQLTESQAADLRHRDSHKLSLNALEDLDLISQRLQDQRVRLVGCSEINQPLIQQTLEDVGMQLTLEHHKSYVSAQDGPPLWDSVALLVIDMTTLNVDEAPLIPAEQPCLWLHESTEAIPKRPSPRHAHLLLPLDPETLRYKVDDVLGYHYQIQHPSPPASPDQTPFQQGLLRAYQTLNDTLDTINTPTDDALPSDHLKHLMADCYRALLSIGAHHLAQQLTQWQQNADRPKELLAALLITGLGKILHMQAIEADHNHHRLSDDHATKSLDLAPLIQALEDYDASAIDILDQMILSAQGIFKRQLTLARQHLTQYRYDEALLLLTTITQSQNANTQR